MDIYKTRDNLRMGLNSVILSNGNPLYTVLDIDSINDIANTLVHYVDKGLTFNITNIHTEIIGNIQMRSLVERLHGDNSATILPSDTAKDMKHKIFILMYTLFLLGEDLDKTMEDLFAFYRSFVINTLDLKEEVHLHDVNAQTFGINDEEVVRIGTDGKLVPTSRTFKHFKHLL